MACDRRNRSVNSHDSTNVLGAIVRSRVRRNGLSAIETIVAFVLLGVIVASVGKFSAFVRQGVQDRQLALQLHWEIENAREVISSWPVAEVTQARIEQLGISAELAEILAQPRWTASVQPQTITGKRQDEPLDPAAAVTPSVQATSVSLRLQAGYRGQQIKPVELIFWLLPEPANRSNSISATVGSISNIINSNAEVAP
jgi:hypothetical protein